VTVSVVVVNLNGLPWLERCLASVRGHETILVDHGSTDGSLELVAQRFPEARVLEQANVGMGGGNNAGMRVATGESFLLLNSDAWAVGDAIGELVLFADAHPEAAVPTRWRLATEYLGLRKLAPRSRALNSLYAGWFDHDAAVEADWLSGACLLVRRSATEEVGLFDESFFMFSEETDWCYRFHQAGWKVFFDPEAEFVHVGGGTHAGELYHENLRSLLRFAAKHHGPEEAERTRRMLVRALRLRGVVFPGERGAAYADAARWLASAPAGRFLH